MRRSEAVAPFLRAEPASVLAEPWSIAGSGVNLDGRVEHWDPDLLLRLDRRLTVDIGLLVSTTGSAGPEGLAVTAVWRSDRTRMRGPGMAVSLAGREDEASISVSLDVPGRLAGGSLIIETLVVRLEADDADSPISARRPGSILWSDRAVVALEGTAARFPVTVLDFAGLTGIADGATWALEWYPRDLTQPVLGAMRLLVNSANPEVVRAVSGEAGAEGAAIVSMIRFDLARSLVHGALRDEDFVQGAREFEPDSVGRMLSQLLERHWPGVDPAILARRLSEVPHRLESQLQQGAGLLA
jgi:hypothetical protein